MGEMVDKDLENLRLLSIFHYIVGAMLALVACLPLVHLVIGIVFITSPEVLVDEAGNLPPPFVGWVFTILGGTMVLMGWSIAACLLCAGRFLARRKHYIFCLVVSALACLIFPFGTILGILTIIVLTKAQVRALFK